jgi:hypothetical protein
VVPDGVPTGIRTPVIAVKGRCPRPLDDGDEARISDGLCEMVRPERFERPTLWFVARYSIQLSYGRTVTTHLLLTAFYCFLPVPLAETEGFEPSIQV